MNAASPIPSLGRLFLNTVERDGAKKAIRYKIGDSYASMSWDEVRSRVEALSSFFLSKGIKKGDRIAILSENRPEWIITDLAALSIGAVTVPIYVTLSAPEVRYILSDAGCRWIALSSRTHLQRILGILPELRSLEGVLVYDKAALAEAVPPAISVVHAEEACRTAVRADLAAHLADVRPEDLASFIYTSGTTGQPKGVMLTHGNFIHNVLCCQTTLKMGESDSHLSFLPLCHVFERTAGYYLMVHIGAGIAYAESLDTVPQNILEIRPTFLLGVPRFFEKIQTRVLDAVHQASPIKKGLFVWAREVGRKRRQGEPIGWLNALLMPAADRLVYRKFAARLGGRLRFCVSGGAALPREVAEFFADLGVLIFEGYGLTETSPVISVNREGRFRFGSVGIPLDSVEVRIAEDGEILTRSESVMQGYFNRPEETASALEGGYFHTGDLGRLDKDGFLHITGRKKEIIVTSGGKKVSPLSIEESLERDEFILRCVLYGEGRKFITALIVPVRERVLEYAQAHKLRHEDYADLLKNKAVYDMMNGRVQSLMQDLAPYERIKYFALLERDFSLEAGEMTPTLKIKRNVILSRYKDLLLPFYELER